MNQYVTVSNNMSYVVKWHYDSRNVIGKLGNWFTYIHESDFKSRREALKWYNTRLKDSKYDINFKIALLDGDNIIKEYVKDYNNV